MRARQMAKHAVVVIAKGHFALRVLHRIACCRAVRRLMVVLVVPEVRDVGTFFVIAIRCRCCPGELERQEEE